MSFAESGNIIIPDSVTEISGYAFWGYDSLTIKDYTGSYAETYAYDNNIPFVSLGGSPIIITTPQDTTTAPLTTTLPDVITETMSTTTKELTTTTTTSAMAGDIDCNNLRDVGDAVAHDAVKAVENGKDYY